MAMMAAVLFVAFVAGGAFGLWVVHLAVSSRHVTTDDLRMVG